MEEKYSLNRIQFPYRSYSLPISVSNRFEGMALVDTGAALNMMPVYYCNKMKIKTLTPTAYQYRGINGYMTRPLGIAEAVPICIGKFVYYTDFIVANLPKDTEIPIILGRAFLRTAQANVDMCNQVTTLGYSDKRIAFNPDSQINSYNSQINYTFRRISGAFAEPERELKKKNKKKSKAGKARPRALNFDMGDEAPMWNTRRTAPILVVNMRTNFSHSSGQ
ncbi:hypothetical protein OSB04_027948 [Centaurea solstitialis]|uniref:Reverse transcriptase domain-containing protein n=1 Tax=Centaurea solstitialis TaxID=347529 RepID=A0AA38W061_9ASTR|nr:hypothetical protein OSB04_027948 [Centaurea solstitialis]